MFGKPIKKFKIYYEESKITEWRFVYFDYKLLKLLLIPFVEIQHFQSIIPGQQTQAIEAYYRSKNKVLPEQSLLPEIKAILESSEKDFLQTIYRELKKCNDFYCLQSQQLEIYMRKLWLNIVILTEKRFKKNLNNFEKKQLTINYYILKETTRSIYKETMMLQEFCHMNRLAASRIIDHYRNKAFFMEDLTKNIQYIDDYQNKLPLYNEAHNLQPIIYEIEDIYISSFSYKNPKNGKSSLRNQIKEKILSNKIVFQFGIFFGICSCFIMTILIHSIDFQKTDSKEIEYYIPMFRGIGLFIFYVWLLGCNVYIWNTCQINYRQIFRFNYHYSSFYQIVKRVSFFTMVYFMVFLICLFKIIDETRQQKNDIYISQITMLIPIDPQVGPLFVWSIILFYFLFPSKKIFNAQGRRFFWNLQWKCIVSAFYKMNFTISWMTDQYVSFVGPFRDVSYTICFYYFYFQKSSDDDKDHYYKQCSNGKGIIYGLLIALIPLVLRMIQCIRQGYDKGKFLYTDEFWNFMKYTASLITAICSFLSKFYPQLKSIWILTAAISMIYAYYWDLTRDWKFFQPDTKKKYFIKGFLRKQLAYDWPQFYYAIMLFNIILRCSWILSISPGSIPLSAQWFSFMISALEIFRRFLWNFIRVEKEHVVNVGEFRVVAQFEFPYDQVYINTNTKNLAINRSEIDTTIVTNTPPLNFIDETSKLQEINQENRFSITFKRVSDRQSYYEQTINEEQSHKQNYVQFQKKFESAKLDQEAKWKLYKQKIDATTQYLKVVSLTEIIEQNQINSPVEEWEINRKSKVSDSSQKNINEEIIFPFFSKQDQIQNG